MTLNNTVRGIDISETQIGSATSSKKIMYPKNASQGSLSRFESNSGQTTPQESSIGAIPVTFKPSSNYNSPNQQQTIPSTAYSSPKYIIEGPGNHQYHNLYGNQGTSYVVVPSTILSPTPFGAYSNSNFTSPGVSADYASYGFVPSYGIVYANSPGGSLSPLNTSKPTKNYPGCC
ncbi:hypothetical protein FG379_001147 [Cryptosporidium bovis]|uniref:uncharacterized protein n=1 Tax=Cryptosporidium bovis TaxID=310047 RepID=UPI00351A0C44|nr:hypothetical protein FG379_001147 [Cryptosporidium bovis]